MIRDISKVLELKRAEEKDHTDLNGGGKRLSE